MSHTPGPWTVGGLFPNGPGFSVTAEGKCYHVCGCGAAQHSHPGAAFTDEECKANGRLIAAAPDLLAACQALIKYCSRRDGSLARYQEWMQAFIEDGSTITEAVERAADAIAKAEGR